MFIKVLFSILALALLGGGGALRAAVPGESVVVVYNSAVPGSKDVAEHYARQRSVPPGQILGLEMATGESMSRSEFRNDLQKPLFRWLEKQKLFTVRIDSMPTTNGGPGISFWKVQDSKIRYAVLCYGIPIRIAEDPALREPTAEKLPQPLRRNGAAVDSELVLLPMQDLKMPVSGPVQSPFYAATNAAILTPTNGILLVARLDGPTPTIAKGLVDKALAAEAHGLWGRAYFDLRGLTNGEYKLGDEWLGTAANFCRQAGYQIITETNAGTFSTAFPMSQIAVYMGWYDGESSGPFTRPEVEFMPGAIAYHLHSFSAATVRSATKNWVGPLLAKGATATMGCVDEPYLAMTPNLGEFMGELLMFGFTFGEAAWACQPALSWQTTVIGDPLYRPFGHKPPELHAKLAAGKNKLLEWSHLAVINLNLVKGYPVEECISYLEENGKESAVLMEKLGELFEQQGKQWPAINAYAQALNLKPSPRQELRLMLLLAEKMESAKRDEEALSICKLLGKNYPDYSDLIAVYKRMVSLANKTGKTAEAEAYEKEVQRLWPVIKK